MFTQLVCSISIILAINVIYTYTVLYVFSMSLKWVNGVYGTVTII